MVHQQSTIILICFFGSAPHPPPPPPRYQNTVYAHSDSFEDYTGGVITDATPYPGITHVVALVGWGTDAETGVDFWAVRNSFGTYWGEQGFYRVQRGINAFNMEVGE